jgi:hypothetical protein
LPNGTYTVTVSQSGFQALAELFELSATELFIPSFSQRTPTLLELGRMVFGEMVFGIGLHVNYA